MHLNTSTQRQPTVLLRTYRDDPRRSFLVNGNAYRREMNRKPEPTVSLAQSLLAAIGVACFAVGVLLVAAGLS